VLWFAPLLQFDTERLAVLQRCHPAGSLEKGSRCKEVEAFRGDVPAWSKVRVIFISEEFFLVLRKFSVVFSSKG
jgi:hypothetical protein